MSQNCGLRIADCGLVWAWVATFVWLFRNPQSAIRNPVR
jgi:hypothetical protein